MNDFLLNFGAKTKKIVGNLSRARISYSIALRRHIRRHLDY